MESNKIINGNCWVAYFDILGFSNMVEKFPVEFIRESYKKALEKGRQSSLTCRFKFFSDSFIFYAENDSQDSFYGISAASELLFQEIFLREIPMRGCLDVGKLYADEENGIFFGQALIDAYLWAEGQDWIGFVLSDETRKKLEGFELAGFKLNKDLYYLEYEVPYKKKPKRRKLLVYYPNILITQPNQGPADYQQERLLKALDIMEFNAQAINKKVNSNKIVNHRKDQEYKKIITKYKNTRDFLSYAYPLLRQRFEQKYPIPKKTNDN